MKDEKSKDRTTHTKGKQSGKIIKLSVARAKQLACARARSLGKHALTAHIISLVLVSPVECTILNNNN